MKNLVIVLVSIALLASACGDDNNNSNSNNADANNSSDADANNSADGDANNGDNTGDQTIAPTVLSTTPLNDAIDVPRNAPITVTFSAAMDPATLIPTTFSLKDETSAVAGTVSHAGTTATFVPTAMLESDTTYTGTVSTDALNTAGKALEETFTWNFTTVTTRETGPGAVNLGTAENYVILAKSGVSTTGSTAVVGDIGLSPAAAESITGFSLSSPAGTFTESALVTGQVWAADYTAPTPSVLTTAVDDMELAYTDAASRVLPDFTELGAGNLDGLTLVPGLYKWGSGVSIPTGVTLTGGADDVWIFQVAQNLTVGNAAIVTLAGGAKAENVFWQVAGEVSLGTTADFKGIIMSKTLIAMETGAIVNGRALAQTAVTLDATAITQP